MRTLNPWVLVALNSIRFTPKSLLKAVTGPEEKSFGFYGPANAFNGLVEV